MVTRRENGVNDAPAKRAAVWPRPRRAPGRCPVFWPLPPADAGRRIEDFPPLVLATCLSTLETKPCPRFFGALGRTRKSSSRRSLIAVPSESCSVSGRAKHADLPALARASRPTRHGGEAAPCRAHPMCRLALRAAGCRPLLSCLPPLTVDFAPGVGARQRCAARSQRPGERGDGHGPGAFEARRLHAGRLRRRLREVRCECTRTARATTRQRPLT